MCPLSCLPLCLSLRQYLSLAPPCLWLTSLFFFFFQAHERNADIAQPLADLCHSASHVFGLNMVDEYKAFITIWTSHSKSFICTVNRALEMERKAQVLSSE